MSDIGRWKGKVALVTGASSGIGRALAERLSAEGLTVYAAARRRERLEELAKSCAGIVPIALDVREEGSILECFERIGAEQKGLDVLVNNAGLGHQESLLDGDTERWREMLEVNLLGLLVCTREALKWMKERPEGHVFHLGSIAGHRVAPNSGLYGASKYAVRSLTESLRQELWEANLPIRVTSVSPGFVETEFHEKHFKSREKSQALYTTHKVLEARDIVDQVMHALSAPPHVAIHDILVRGLRQQY